VRRLGTVALWAMSLTAVGCTSHAVRSMMPGPLQGLGAASTRDEAVCSLLRRGEYAVASPRCRQEAPANGCKVRSVFDNTLRPNGTVVVLLNPDWQDPELPDRPDVGVLVLFDVAGRIVPVFEAASYLNGFDGVVRYRHDGDLAVVHQFAYAGDPDWSVEALHVVPATADQTPILTVLMGLPHGRFAEPESPQWTWRANDTDGDENLEFQIGPIQADGSIETKATYHYSAVSKQYEGPGGAPDGEFYLAQPPQPACNWAVAEKFARAHGLPSDPTPCSCEQ
jgi:hypothetical protein